MVKAASRLTLLAAFTFSSLLKLPATEFSDYKIGDIAREDIIARAQMVVIDPEETAALKQKEAGRVPVIWRYYTNAVDEVEGAFRSAFAVTRSNLLIVVERYSWG